jgi:hypothetical protein
MPALTPVYVRNILQLMEPTRDLLAGVTGFEWDQGNSEKNWRRHGVSQVEAEQAFLNRPLLVAPSPKEIQGEARYFALAQSDLGRSLAIVFTLRGSRVRVISARPMSRRERKAHAEAEATQDDSRV